MAVICSVINVKACGAKGDGVTDDTAAIAVAFGNLPSTGGTIRFPAGNYLVSAATVIPTTPLSVEQDYGGIVIEGDGMGISTITYVGTSASIFTCTVPSASYLFNLTFRNLGIVATNVAYNAWHVTTQNVNRVVFDGVLVSGYNPTGADVGGIKLLGGVGVTDTFYPTFRNSVTEGCTIWLDTVTDGWITDSVVQGLIGAATGGRTEGILLSGTCTNIKISRCHLYPAANGAIYQNASTSIGINVSDNFFDTNPALTTAVAIFNATATNSMVISNNVFAGTPGSALDLVDFNYGVIEGNSFYTCGNGTTTTANTIEFSKSVTGCNYTVVSNNNFVNGTNPGTPGYAIAESGTSTCAGMLYSENSVYGAGYVVPAVSFGSSNNSVMENWTGTTVVETQGTGVVASGTTSIAVAHSLSYTPSGEDIYLCPQQSLGSATTWWVSTITSTHFTINVNTNPEQNVTFGWHAKYRSQATDPT